MAYSLEDCGLCSQVKNCTQWECHGWLRKTASAGQDLLLCVRLSTTTLCEVTRSTWARIAVYVQATADVLFNTELLA